MSPSCKVMVAGLASRPVTKGGDLRMSRPMPFDRSHAVSFLVKRAGGRGRPSENRMMAPSGAVS